LHSRRIQARPDEVYLRYLLAVRQLAKARGATLLVEPRAENQHQSLLIHEGEAGPVPELADEKTAAETVATLAFDDHREIPPGQSMIRYYPSAAGDGCLLRIGVGLAPWLAADEKALPANGDRRSSDQGENVAPLDESVWIGLRYGDTPVSPDLARLRDPGTGEPQTPAEWLSHILVLGASRAWETCQLSALLRDPTSQLPGRAEFQARLKNTFHAANHNAGPMGLLLINPDDFGVINQRLDRESGDQALAEVAQMLRDCLRRSDPVFRYGGAVFAALMPGASETAVETVAKKIRQVMTGAYLDGAVRLSFSVGAVVYQRETEEDGDLDELGLLRRADHALNLAKRAGGDCSVLWNPDETVIPGAGQDRLSGIFTANAEKDYRNMLLLWDTITVMSSGAEEEEIAADFVARIHMSLKPRRAGCRKNSGNCLSWCRKATHRSKWSFPAWTPRPGSGSPISRTPCPCWPANATWAAFTWTARSTPWHWIPPTGYSSMPWLARLHWHWIAPTSPPATRKRQNGNTSVCARKCRNCARS
jgi:diguanylate cyclase (GGDEF)-like protein